MSDVPNNPAKKIRAQRYALLQKTMHIFPQADHLLRLRHRL